jgi:hypothetical protein
MLNLKELGINETVPTEQAVIDKTLSKDLVLVVVDFHKI